MDRLDVQVLLENLDQLPTLPFVAVELLTQVQEGEASAQDIAHLIEKDQALTFQVLRLSNSAFYRRARPVATVKDAVVSVGLDAVKMLVLSVSVLKVFNASHEEETSAFSHRRFWLHSLACATAARIICASKHPTLSEIAFVAGLLHDVGKAALNELVPERYAQAIAFSRSQRVSALEAERNILGVDHVVVGNLLAEKWNLPTSLRDVIWLHHQPAFHTGPEELRFVLRAVHVADWVCNQYGLSVDPEAGWPTAEVDEVEHIGLSAERIYPRLREELQESVSMFDVVEPSADLFLDLLQKSNRQLGKLSQETHQNLLVTQRSNRVIEALADMGEKLQSVIHLTDMAQAVVAGTLRGLDADAVAVRISVGGGRALQAITRRIDEDNVKTEFNLIQEESAGGFVVSDTWVEGDRVQLIAGGRTMGHLTAWYDSLRRTPHPDTASDIASDIALFAHMGAPALERARLRAVVDEKLESLPAAVTARAEAAEKGGPLEPAPGHGREYPLLEEVMAAIGHEFNNLLSGILAQAELIEVTEADPAKKKRLQSIESAVTDAAALISRYQKKFSKKLPTDTQTVADLEQTAREVLELQGQRRPYEEQAIDFEVQPGGPWLAIANASEIKEVITNLLLNALDATREKGEVSIKVGSEGGHVFVRVEDTGHGIPPQSLNRIFDPFFTTKEEQGTGIGLTISRSILKNHGGDLKASSRPGLGSEFEARLPRWKGEISTSDAEEEVTPLHRKVKALVVEDNDQMRDSLRDILLSLEIDADLAADASRAEELLGIEVYDFVITDLHLKESSGLDVIRFLKDRRLHTPALLITGKWESGEQLRVEGSGVAGVLFKPFTIRQLSGAISKILEDSSTGSIVLHAGERPDAPSQGKPNGSLGKDANPD